MNFKSFFLESTTAIDQFFTKELKKAVLNDDTNLDRSALCILEDDTLVKRNVNTFASAHILSKLKPVSVVKYTEKFERSRYWENDDSLGTNNWAVVSESEWSEAVWQTQKFIELHKGLEDEIDQIPDL